MTGQVGLREGLLTGGRLELAGSHIVLEQESFCQREYWCLVADGEGANVQQRHTLGGKKKQAKTLGGF